MIQNRNMDSIDANNNMERNTEYLQAWHAINLIGHWTYTI
jgi:hypothetical protein